MGLIIKHKLIDQKFPFAKHLVPIKTSTYDFKYLDSAISNLMFQINVAFEKEREFTANASHELRTPITSIIGEVELALNKERSPEETKKTLQLVLEESERLRDTISGLMELAQVDMDYTIAQQSPIRMDELLWDVQAYWVNKAGADALQINIEHMPADETMLTIPANYQLLFIALNNLIGNAFKFSNQKPVKCNFYADEELIRMQIIDSGIGIPKEDLDFVFKSFYRATNSHNFVGSGIGLYVTQKIIQLFKGTLQVESVEGQGTAITIKFIRN
ncbi:MAG: HAMP domain-containing histidine kinase [Mucilaginibacter sp.]|nr:HAMP domain-containing histidine kinase [Mucilaginibacter sp.]